MRILGWIVLVALSSPLLASDEVDKARALFELYVQRGRAFDPALADLYSDEAVIKNKRGEPEGEVRELSLPAPQYKDLIRQALPVAKVRGDTSTYSDVEYAIEGDGVRIKADRFSEMKGYHSPISILVKPTPTGEWLIFEELSESRP